MEISQHMAPHLNANMQRHNASNIARNKLFVICNQIIKTWFTFEVHCPSTIKSIFNAVGNTPEVYSGISS
jgi:hypothetical protein